MINYQTLSKHILQNVSNKQLNVIEKNQRNVCVREEIKYEGVVWKCGFELLKKMSLNSDSHAIMYIVMDF